jgi:hypothetical protein
MAKEEQEQQFHFFASSVAEWKTDTSIFDLIKTMDKAKLNYSLWYIPRPANAMYAIKMYTPQVDERIFLGQRTF